MRYIIMFLFVAFLAASPVYMLDKLVMPELNKLKNTYSNLDATAQQVAEAK